MEKNRWAGFTATPALSISHESSVKSVRPFATSTATAEEPDSVELGAVAWKRDFPAAKKMAQESGKPLLMFFQEVPG